MLTGHAGGAKSPRRRANDLWSVNTDQEYHEEVRESELEAVLSQVFAKLDRGALGTAVGGVSAAALALLTLLLLVQGSGPAADFVGLLGQYFPGYSVSGPGVLLGLLYGFAAGFGVGWTFALARNTAAFLYELLIRRRAEALVLRDILDYV